GATLASERRPVEHLLHDRVLLELLAPHRRIDQSGRDRIDPAAPRTPTQGRPGRGANDASLRQRVRVTAVADDTRAAVEEAGGERVVEQLVLLGLGNGSDMVRGGG